MSSDISSKRITIIGSTGSIGTSTCEVIDSMPDRFDVVGLAARNNVETLTDQVSKYRPKVVAVLDETAAETCRDELTRFGAALLTGQDGVTELAGMPDTDLVVGAAVGAGGLAPLFAAIDAGHTVALANKEPLVMAGELVMARARERGVDVLPVDSEHNALFQCLEGKDPLEVRRVILTASGGPFYGSTLSELADITPAQAVDHPTWDMGPKVSVDSATLMNKGLEVIEAMCLFGLPLDKVEILIHPQSIIHGMVEFVDGGVLAYVSRPDMKTPIQHALTWPERTVTSFERIDIVRSSPWTFAEPELDQFPCLALARRAASRGGTYPAVLSAANEVAVETFMDGGISFTDIPTIVEQTMAAHVESELFSLDTVLAADRWARSYARELTTADRDLTKGVSS
ncbi:MAG: 1-deoxy-D-xylulose-5-phosphate reductoisomerase [Candidatus Hydrogenedentes bacterium]|nr:1-deoxy-D-xylulose-5-phosphate reductoisomerase [Candidatus Hydrogenedentota bacterium]